MPSGPPAFVAGEDGRYHCNEQRNEAGELEFPDCNRYYDMAQHLGLHRYHHHDIKGKSRRHDGSPKTPSKRGRLPKDRPAMVTAEDICTMALEALAPSGSIPVHAIPSFNEWVRQTEAFLGKLLG